MFPQDVVTIDGETRDYAGRFFCPRCGSSIFARTADEIEVNVGSLDAPDQLMPTYGLRLHLSVFQTSESVASFHRPPTFSQTTTYREQLEEAQERAAQSEQPRAGAATGSRENKRGGAAATRALALVTPPAPSCTM